MGLWDFLRKNLLPLSGLLLVIYGCGGGEGGFMLGRQIMKGRFGIERTGQVLRLVPEQR
jgi:hypothetical protein